MSSPQHYNVFQQVQDCFGYGPDIFWVVVNETHPVGIYDTFEEANHAQLVGRIFAGSYKKGRLNGGNKEEFNSFKKTCLDLMEKVNGPVCARIAWISVLFFFYMKHEYMLVRNPTFQTSLRIKVVEFKSYVDNHSDTYSSKIITKTMPDFMNRINLTLPRIPTHSYNLRSRK